MPSRGLNPALQLLESLLPSPARYVGLFGSRTPVERLLQDLDQAGVNLTRNRRNKLHTPIGLDIGAESCKEIALAIVAEIRAVLAGRVGGRLRDRQTPIHERRPTERLFRSIQKTGAA